SKMDDRTSFVRWTENLGKSNGVRDVGWANRWRSLTVYVNDSRRRPSQGNDFFGVHSSSTWGEIFCIFTEVGRERAADKKNKGSWRGAGGLRPCRRCRFMSTFRNDR